MLKAKGTQKYSIMFSLMLGILAVFAVFTLFFGVLLVDHRTKDLIKAADEKLLIAAELTREIFGADYHDRIVDEKSISKKEFADLVARNDELCRRLNLQYLWSVLLVGDRIVFTSATHSDVRNPQSHVASFFEPHQDPDAFAGAIHALLKPSFSSFKNEWGEGRMVLVARKDVHGRTYIFGASVQLREFNSLILRSVLTTAGIALAIFGVACLLVLLWVRSLTAPIALLTLAAQRIAEGDLDGPMPSASTREILALSDSFNEMRKRLKETLGRVVESERHLRTVILASPIALWEIDRDATLLLAEGRAFAQLGLKLGDGVGQSLFELHNDNAEVLASISRGLAGKEFSDECYLRGRYWINHYVPIRDPKGEVSGLVGVSVDISERKSAEIALKKTTEQYALLFGTMQQGVVFQEQEGPISSMNPAAVGILGFSPAEFLGKTSENLETVTRKENGEPFPGAEHPSMVALKTGKVVRDVVMQVYNPRVKEYRWINVTAVPLFLEQAKVPHQVFTVFSDITARVLMEQELRIAQETSEQAYRAKSQFLDIAAHELRTPVTAMSLLLQLAQKQFDQGRAVEAPILLQLSRQMDRLACLVVDLLDVSRLERGSVTLRREPTDLIALVSESLNTFALLAPTRPIAFVKPAQPLKIELDPVRISQVLSNLLENAIRYTKENVAIEVSLETNEERIRVSVKDHGAGISEKEQAELFKPMFRGVSDEVVRSSGLGLGLFVCREVMRLHGGTIGVSSRMGQGSIFYFELPRKGHG